MSALITNEAVDLHYKGYNKFWVPQICSFRFHCVQQFCLLSVGFKWACLNTYVEEKLAATGEMECLTTPPSELG